MSTSTAASLPSFSLLTYRLLADLEAQIRPMRLRVRHSNTPWQGPAMKRNRRGPTAFHGVSAKHATAGNLPIVRPQGNLSTLYQTVKRVLDIVGSIMLLVLLSPLLLTTLVVLTITTKGRPLFIQERVGHLGRRFPMLKFRSMRLDAEQWQSDVENEQKEGPVFKNRRDPRITRIGRFLRKTSIDELPQLLNVLVGQMSLVGPRPPVPQEVAEYQPWHRNRLSVKPGLTCLWQVSGRCEIGFEDWVRMDIWYVNHQNLWTDLKMLISTPYSVLSCRGAY